MIWNDMPVSPRLRRPWLGGSGGHMRKQGPRNSCGELDPSIDFVVPIVQSLMGLINVE